MTQEEIAAQVSEQINQIAPELTKTNWDRLLDTGLDYLVLAAKALIVLAVGYFLIRWLLKISKRGLKRSHISKTLHAFILSTIKIVDYVFLILIVMSVLGIPTTSLITAVGTAGVAIGLALKDSLSNFASGVLLLANAPFKDGDFVDIGGQSGVVTQIGLMNTTLKTLDNRHIVVPNNTVAKSTIINYSTEKLRRLDLNFAILGKGDPQVAIDLIQSVLEEEKDRILEEPEKPFLRLTGFSAEGNATLTLRVWVKAENLWDLNYDLLQKIKRTFDRNTMVIITK